MHTFIIAAMTADGYIAKDAHHLASWTSREDKQFFVQRTKRAGVVIMGANTFETFGKPLRDRLNIIYSRSKKIEGVEMTNLPPAELLQSLEKRGYQEVAICGGTSVYTMFLKAGVVDTLYLTVEPLLFGKGISILNEPLDITLNLKTLKRLNSNGTLLLEYGVSG